MRSWAWYHPLLRDTPKDHLISYHPHTGSSTVWANGTPALLYAKSQWSHCDHHDNMDTVTDYSSTIPPLLPATISTHTQRDRYDLKGRGEWGVKRECRREQCLMNTQTGIKGSGWLRGDSPVEMLESPKSFHIISVPPHTEFHLEVLAFRSPVWHSWNANSHLWSFFVKS